MKLQEPVYIIDALRTPIAVPFKGLKGFTSAQMAAVVMAEILERNEIPNDWVKEVVFGSAVLAGSGQNFARQAAFLAGLPATPAYVVSNVCGAGLQSVILAAQSVLLGSADLTIAGGTESATHTPYFIARALEMDLKNRVPIDSLIYDGLWCVLTGKHMGEICEALAKKGRISRRVQDEYVLESHVKAYAARLNNKLQREIIPIRFVPFPQEEVPAEEIFSCDEHVRKHVSLERLSELPAAFKRKGTVTAGNASLPCDGAAVVLLASRQFVQKEDIQPMARVVGYVSVIDDPRETFFVGISAVRQCLNVCNLSIEDIDLFEISESFAAQAILMRDELNIPKEKMNIYGGDIALGHPLGAAGTRVLVTLVHALSNENKKRGLACICFGGGGAIVVIIERESY